MHDSCLKPYIHMAILQLTLDQTGRGHGVVH